MNQRRPVWWQYAAGGAISGICISLFVGPLFVIWDIETSFFSSMAVLTVGMICLASIRYFHDTTLHRAMRDVERAYNALIEE